MTPSTRVRVFFGRHVIAEYLADQEKADRYVEAIRRRFAGLRVELQSGPCVHGETHELPEEWQWGWPPT